MKPARYIASLGMLTVISFVLGACGKEPPKAAPMGNEPANYQSRLNDPNVSEQEKETIRRSMANQGQLGSTPGATAAPGSESAGDK